MAFSNLQDLYKCCVRVVFPSSATWEYNLFYVVSFLFTDELQTEIASLKVQLESLNQEKEIDIKRMEEFISQSARLELQNASL